MAALSYNTTAAEQGCDDYRYRAAGFAHQVRTPLASALLYAGQLDTSTPGQKKVVDRITARLNDLGRMVNEMLGFAAGAQPARKCVQVIDLFGAVRRTIEPQLSRPGAFSVDSEPGLAIRANKAALKGALLNLINNAEQACGDDANIQLTARRDDDRVLLSVCDNGGGISKNVLGRLFEPFFTTRSNGTGLGLAIVLEVTRAHDGEVTVRTSDQGSCFTMSLPLAEHGEQRHG